MEISLPSQNTRRHIACTRDKPDPNSQSTVKASIKAPLKIVLRSAKTPWSEKNIYISGPLGAPCLERRLQIRAQLRPFQSELQRTSYNRPRWRCRMHTKLEVRLTAILSEVEILQQQSKNSLESRSSRVGNLSKYKKRPSKMIYAAKAELEREKLPV